MIEVIIPIRQQLKDLIEYANLRRNQSQEYLALAIETEEKMNEIISAIIMEEEMLVGTKWTIEVHNDNTVCLHNPIEEDDEKIKAISELIRPIYHALFSLREGIGLRDNSYNLTLEFQDVGLIPAFVKELNLQVDTASVNKRLHTLKREIRNLENLAHLFNI